MRWIYCFLIHWSSWALNVRKNEDHLTFVLLGELNTYSTTQVKYSLSYLDVVVAIFGVILH